MTNASENPLPDLNASDPRPVVLNFLSDTVAQNPDPATIRLSDSDEHLARLTGTLPTLTTPKSSPLSGFHTATAPSFYDPNYLRNLDRFDPHSPAPSKPASMFWTTLWQRLRTALAPKPRPAQPKPAAPPVAKPVAKVKKPVAKEPAAKPKAPAPQPVSTAISATADLDTRLKLQSQLQSKDPGGKRV